MRFTEHELTVSVDAVARSLFSATRPPWRRREVEAAWESLPRLDKYHRKAAVGEAVLPALVRLPERPTVGARPHFTDEEYVEAATAASQALLESRTPGAWEAMSERKRRRLVRATSMLTRQAVAAMPVRQDPDALIGPDAT